MGADRSYIAENEAQLTRMRNLVDSLSAEELAAPMEAGWTVAAVLGHLAFINPLRADHRREHLDDIEQSRSRR